MDDRWHLDADVDFAYDMGWIYAEDHPEEDRINDNPHKKDVERELYDAWRDGFFACRTHLAE